MRLTDLDPRALLHDGRVIGLTFLCPHCQNVRLTCFYEATGFKQQVRVMLPITGRSPGDKIDWVPSNQDFAWTAVGADFDTLTITPSIDASKSGHWHGHIRDGAITA